MQSSLTVEAYSRLPCHKLLTCLLRAFTRHLAQQTPEGGLKVVSEYRVPTERGLPTELIVRDAPPYVVVPKVLSLRLRSDAQDTLTANILFSQLKVYPQMLAEGFKLPPFIFPPCCLSIEGQCPSDSTHTCLPEILAICASLTQMFVSRTPGSVDFVWKQIHAEVRRLGCCVSPETSLNTARALLTRVASESLLR